MGFFRKVARNKLRRAGKLRGSSWGRRTCPNINSILKSDKIKISGSCKHLVKELESYKFSKPRNTLKPHQRHIKEDITHV